MDQEKIGKFISTCRKDKGLTQMQLADKLGITDRAVSKWETGKSLPDASIMIELCEILNINVNELLTGEHIVMENYKDIAETNLLDMTKQIEQKDSTLLKIEKVMMWVVVPVYVALVIIGSYICKSNAALGIALIVIALMSVIPFAIIALKIEHDAGYYECPNCGERYVPTMSAVIWAPHMGTSRKMVCPHCGKKGYHKKVISKNR
ncbi:MAG: helix-turn-helix domain-containing protein [Saccharofermentans sp.]|nr:helix-turn-helix domain-containing protein [Saccharofermentans sp.]